MAKIVAVMACPTGIAHTVMAAEALERTAKIMGHTLRAEMQGSVGAKNILTEQEIRAADTVIIATDIHISMDRFGGKPVHGYEMKVETQGSVGAQNTLTFEEIGRADAAIIAADAYVDKTRFVGKRLYETGTKEALHAGPEVIKKALALPEPGGGDLADVAREMKKARAAKVTGPYKHLMTGVSYMLPIVVAGGILIALAFLFGGITTTGYPEGSLAWALMMIGGTTAFALFVPVLAAFIAYSIADRPGITPGIIGGLLATSIGSGFLGGIIAGFLAGYVTLALNKYIKLPKNLQGLMPVLILPLLSTLVTGLAMVFVIGPPMKWVNDTMTTWLQGLQTGSAAALGVILGAMMAFDMGGPVNKAAYAFSVGLLASQVYEPMAAVMAAGMTPPLSLALAAFIPRKPT